MDRPVAFPGSCEEAAENFLTHRFDQDGTCMVCDCTAGMTVSRYPCGEEPPRETVVFRNGFQVASACAPPSVSPDVPF